MKPEDLLFAETHEWVHVAEENGSKIATLGISAFAVEQLTDLIYLELPEVGKTIQAGTEIGEVESVKAVSPIYSPLDGEVIEVNTALADSVESLGDSPYDRGWIAKLRITDASGLADLMDYETYRKQCESEGH